MKAKSLILLSSFFALTTFASEYECSEKDLLSGEDTIGSYRRVTLNENDKVATINYLQIGQTVKLTAKQSWNGVPDETSYIGLTANGVIQDSFDLSPTKESGVLIHRLYGTSENCPADESLPCGHSQIFICSKK